MSSKHLIIGLGNPGRDYKGNRHNVGFQIVDKLADRHTISFGRQQARAFVATGRIAGHSAMLVKPQTYMNRSGESVGEIQRYYKIPLEQILVVYDDLDLPIGTVRLRPEGGAGGQKGMKSIINHLGSQQFARLRVGIGRPPGRMDAADYVLQDFSSEQEQIMDEVRYTACNAIETWLKSGTEEAMNRYNGSVE